MVAPVVAVPCRTAVGGTKAAAVGARARAEPAEQRPDLLPIVLRDRDVVRLRGRSFEVAHPRRKPFLLSRVIEIKPEQKFFPGLI